MSYEIWLRRLQLAEKKSLIQRNVRKIAYKFQDGEEMCEEYSMDTGIILRRMWKQKKELIGEATWKTELGDTPRSLSEPFEVKESATEPILSKRITRHSIEWRIRNLPYSIETYAVAANTGQPSITVRTTNKKYFKNIHVPELERCLLQTEQDAISLKHQLNTLIITYKKPALVVEMEASVLLMLKEVETETDTDIDCNDILNQLMQ